MVSCILPHAFLKICQAVVLLKKNLAAKVFFFSQFQILVIVEYVVFSL